MWQSFYEAHKHEHFLVLGVAMDVQGPAVARPYYEKYGVTFPRLVDRENRLGAVFGLDAVPNVHVIDEMGLFRGAGLSQAEIAAFLQEPVATGLNGPGRRPSLEARAAQAKEQPHNASALAAYADALREAKRFPEARSFYNRALAADRRCLPAYFGLSAIYLAQGNRAKAAEVLKDARKLFPKNWIVRKQIWALEHPERFYAGEVDYAWQKKQLAAENGE